MHRPWPTARSTRSSPQGVADDLVSGGLRVPAGGARVGQVVGKARPQSTPPRCHSASRFYSQATKWTAACEPGDQTCAPANQLSCPTLRCLRGWAGRGPPLAVTWWWGVYLCAWLMGTGRRNLRVANPCVRESILTRSGFLGSGRVPRWYVEGQGSITSRAGSAVTVDAGARPHLTSGICALGHVGDASESQL